MSHTQPPPPFRVRRADNPGPVVASLPHSGLYVPQSMTARLSEPFSRFLPHQDWHLDRLYDFLPELGVTAIHATHSRYVADLNRALVNPAFGSFWRSVVPQSSPSNKALYKGASEPPASDISARIESVYEPYHAALQTLVEATLNRWRVAWLLDLHSYQLPDHEMVCLGNANGSSCDDNFLQAAEAAFVGAGFKVQLNKPFNGGHITRRYAQMENVQCLQIEATYNLYLNRFEIEQAKVPDANVPELLAARPRFEQALRELVGFAISAQAKSTVLDQARDKALA